MSRDVDHLTDRETSRLSERFGPLLFLPGLGVAASDAKTGRFLEVNDEFCRLTGYTAAELKERSSLDLLHPEDRRPDFDLASRLLHGEIPGFRAEERYLRRDGGTIRVEVESTVFREEPQPWVLSLVRDVTARQAAEEALREGERRSREMADAAPVMIWLSDAGKRSTYFNQAWLSFTGRAQAQQLGYGWVEGVHPDDLQRCLAAYEAAVAARQPFQVEYRLRRHDGAYRWMLDQAVPRSTGGNFAGFAGALVDITERKQEELDLAAAKEAAEAGNHERDRFFATLSHELRTPLAPMLAVADRFDRDPAFGAQHRAGLGIIRRNIELEARLIDELLDVTRITGGKLEIKRERIDLHAVLRWAVEMSRPGGVLGPPGEETGGGPALDNGAGRHRPLAVGRRGEAHPGARRGRRQRPQVHAAGRHGHRAHARGAGAGRETSRRAAPARHRGRGHRHRHPRRGPAPHLRPLRAGGALHRAPLRRPGARPRHRALDRRVHGGSPAASAGEGRGACFTVRLPGAESAGSRRRRRQPRRRSPEPGAAEEEKTPPLSHPARRGPSRHGATPSRSSSELLGHTGQDRLPLVAEPWKMAEVGAQPGTARPSRS